MHIEASGLVAALKEAPEAQVLPRQMVSDYMVEHIYIPLRRGMPLLFEELDFDAFDEDDVRALENWLSQLDELTHKLDTLAEIFHAAGPVSRPGRAFC